MNDLVSWATEYPSATAGALSPGAPTNTPTTSHLFSTGFRAEFTDTFRGSSDQVRHAVGGLFAGFVGGRAGQEFMNRWRESQWHDNDPPQSHAADTALNNLTIPMGEELYGDNRFKAAQGLGKWIRDNLCETHESAGGRGN